MAVLHLIKKIILFLGCLCHKIGAYAWRKIFRKKAGSRTSIAPNAHSRRLAFSPPHKTSRGKGSLKSEHIRTLEVMPTEVKIQYTQILALQALADNHLAQCEFSDLYVFMAQIGLDAQARRRVRTSLLDQRLDQIGLVDQILTQVQTEERQVLRFSIVKDMIRVSRMDGEVSREEEENIRKIAKHLYHTDEKASQIIIFAEKAIEYDEKLLKGKLSIEEFAQGAKNLAATATSIGVPVTAVYFSGSVIGLSAAGIISGLTELGLGGILGFSSLITGLGIVVVMGVVTFKLMNWAITGKDRKMEKMREYMIQEIIKLNQQAMLALAEDINLLASDMERLTTVSAQNQQALEQLKTLYHTALHVLEDRKEHYAES